MTDGRAIKRGDTVVMPAIASPDEVVGIVVRVARHGAWADVHWYQKGTGAMWVKRQPDRTKLTVLEH